jgi:hypothetical protein
MLQHRKQHTVGPSRSRLVTPHSASEAHRSSRESAGTDCEAAAVDGAASVALGRSPRALFTLGSAREHDAPRAMIAQALMSIGRLRRSSEDEDLERRTQLGHGRALAAEGHEDIVRARAARD